MILELFSIYIRMFYYTSLLSFGYDFCRPSTTLSVIWNWRRLSFHFYDDRDRYDIITKKGLLPFGILSYITNIDMDIKGLVVNKSENSERKIE